MTRMDNILNSENSENERAATAVFIRVHHEDLSLLKLTVFFSMYDNFSSDRSNSWSPVAISFLAGVSSASIIWYTLGKIRRESVLSEEKELIASFRQWWLRDIQSRIGELPSLRRRTPWTWDRKNRSGSSHPSTPDKKGTTSTSASTNSTSQSTSNNDSTSAASPSPVDEKSGLCIGSIFGLDVGGTLAKLVYFEQKAETMDHDRAGHRERNYRFSASARAVFMARRGAGDEEEDSGGTASPRAHSSTGDVMGQAAWIPSRIRRRSLDMATTRPLHSNDSDKDLESLNIVRNESLPDDLHAYAETVGPPHARARGAGSVDDGSGTIFREKSENENDHLATDEDAEIRKSRSMLDFLKSRDHAEALDRFYNLARRLDSYREGVKDHELSFYSRELGGEFHFIRFETRRMQNAMDLIRANNLHLNICEMGATGGGAHKFAAKWEQDLAIQMQKQDELDSLVAGMQFVLSTVVGECYTFRPHDAASARSSSHGSSNSSGDGSSDNNVDAPTDEDDDVDNKTAPEERGKVDEWWWSRKVQRDAISYSSTYPYLLVTIGTGVSILRVDGPRKHERISGSTIGGGTYWGLIRLLTDLEDFEDVMKLAERGDPSKVDMMVGDIYGENSDALEKIGLTSNLVASSFGKLVAMEDPAVGLKEEDLARALLLMVTNNIGQVAYLNAQLHKTPRIYFVGNFLRQNKISQKRLSYAINYWSKGKMEALFLEHEGYFGALGAFLLSQGVPHNLRKESNDGDKTVPESLHRRRHTVVGP